MKGRPGSLSAGDAASVRILPMLQKGDIDGAMDVAKDMDVQIQNLKFPSGLTAVHVIVAHQPDKLEYLLSSLKGSDVRALDDKEETPLHIAAAIGTIDTAELLLENHADVNARDNKGYTPLMWAAYRNNTGVLKLLCTTHRVSIDAVNNEGHSALYFASFLGHRECVEILLEANAKVDFRPTIGGTAGIQSLLRERTLRPDKTDKTMSEFLMKEWAETSGKVSFSPS